MLKRIAKIDSENCMISGYHAAVGQAPGLSGPQGILPFPAKPCNLSTCRYAYPIGAVIACGCRPSKWCGMLVDFELIKRAQKGDSGLQRNRIGIPEAHFGDDRPVDRPPRRCRGRRTGSLLAIVFFARPTADARGL